MAEPVFDAVPTAIEAIRSGGFAVVADDEDRENEGDLILAAEHLTPAKMAFLLRHTSGLVCAAFPPERLAQLRIPPMVQDNTDSHGTAFMVSVDHRTRTSTGISAEDRSATITAMVDPAARAEDFARPGHVFPLQARVGGVLTRTGHTEAAVDLARLAGLAPAGVLCELTNDDGTMSRLPQLRAFADRHGLPLISIADLVQHRLRSEQLVTRVAEAQISTDFGPFRAVAFRSSVDGIEHVAYVMGEVDPEVPALTRVHSECLTGDVFSSRRCDCGAQLRMSLERIAAEGRGAVVYLRGHEGRGIGLAHKLRAYNLQDGGLDTVDANLRLGLPVDTREYGTGAQILRALGFRRLRLMTNNPRKQLGLQGYGLEIVERVPLLPTPTADNISYLVAKERRLEHELDLGGPADHWVMPASW